MLKRNNLLALIVIACVISSINTGSATKVEEETESFSVILVPITDNPKGLSDYDQIKIGSRNGEIVSAYNEVIKRYVDVNKIKERVNEIR